MTALVLCGGGSRGAVEVGLYRALAELGVPVDLVVGTSVGAINGAAVAADIPPDALARLWRDLTRRDLFRLNRQLLWKLIWADSLYDHRPLRRFLERSLPVRRFEDLAIPLIVTGTNFETGQPVYWRGGDLVDAIMASVAMPGLFPSQVIGGVQVVDGGITDNVPIDVAVAEGADTVIVMLCACCERASRPERGLLRILRRALSIAIDRKYHAEVQHYAGRARLIALEPPMSLAIDPLDFSHTAELIEQGYTCAMIALKDGLASRARDGRDVVHRPRDGPAPVISAETSAETGRREGSDAELIEVLRAGGERGVEELVSRYAGLVYRVALRVTGNRDDAEGVTGEVMRTASTKVASFRGDSALSSWIYRIATNAAYEKVRARGASTLPLEEGLSAAEASSTGGLRDWSRFCDDPALQLELRRVLEEAIQELPADDRYSFRPIGERR